MPTDNFDYLNSPITLGTVLWFEFLEPYNISPGELAQELGITEYDVINILYGKCNITPEIASSLDQYFTIKAGFFNQLQASINRRNEQINLITDFELA